MCVLFQGKSHLKLPSSIFVGGEVIGKISREIKPSDFGPVWVAWKLGTSQSPRPCWWFRNPIPNHLGSGTPVVNNGMSNYRPPNWWTQDFWTINSIWLMALFYLVLFFPWSLLTIVLPWRVHGTNGLFTYNFWLIFWVHVGRYNHGAYGVWIELSLYK